MDRNGSATDGRLMQPQGPAIRFLVESALRKLSARRSGQMPRNRAQWVEALTDALLSDAETSHQGVLASLIATGVSSDEIQDYFVPAAARRLGELWVEDKVSFTDVTVGAGRLQALFRNRADTARGSPPSIPMGQSFLMVIPAFEDHALGAFLAADQLRRHGVWVHMGIGLRHDEIARLLDMRRFAAVGLSAGTTNAVDKVTEVIDYLRSNMNHLPPIVVGGRVVGENRRIAERTGADHAVRSAREAIERCGLSTVGPELSVGRLE